MKGELLLRQSAIPKLGICQWAIPIKGPDACLTVSGLGLQGVQLEIGSYKSLYDLSDERIQKSYIKAGKATKITFPSIAVRETDNFNMMGSENSTEYRIANEAIIKAIEAANIMKIPTVMIPSFEESNIITKSDFNQAVHVFKNACDYAASKGVLIATENVLSIEDVLKLFSSVNRPNFKLYFDTQNHYLHKEYDTPYLLEHLMPYICEIHVKDGKGKDLSGALLGEGDTNFFGSMEVLKNNNYSGWLLLENYYDQEPLCFKNVDPIVLLRQDIKTLKDIFIE